MCKFTVQNAYGAQIFLENSMFRKYLFQMIIFGGKILNNFQYFRFLDNDFQSKNNDLVPARLLYAGRFFVLADYVVPADLQSAGI